MNKQWRLTEEEARFFTQISNENKKEGKPQVLWGWKRDLVVNKEVLPESRTVYFSADLGLDAKNTLFIKQAYFFLSSRAKEDEITALAKVIGASLSASDIRLPSTSSGPEFTEGSSVEALKISNTLGEYRLTTNVSPEPGYSGFLRLTIAIGKPTQYDTKAVNRLLWRRPRFIIEPPRIIPQWQSFDISSFAPFSLYCGSGLSTESGLPLLGTIHSMFHVDDPDANEFIFGAKDQLPTQLVQDVDDVFKTFCQFTVDAIHTKPSPSHEIIADFYRKGVIKQVFTDNMDHILRKVGVPYTQTRVSIFPDRFPVKFDPSVRTLLVIGVAVDRREVIKQARGRRIRIIAINPVLGVAPHSRNIDYLVRGDIFFKGTAGEILPKMAEHFQ